MIKPQRMWTNKISMQSTQLIDFSFSLHKLVSNHIMTQFCYRWKLDSRQSLLKTVNGRPQHLKLQWNNLLYVMTECQTSSTFLNLQMISSFEPKPERKSLSCEFSILLARERCVLAQHWIWILYDPNKLCALILLHHGQWSIRRSSVNNWVLHNP